MFRVASKGVNIVAMCTLVLYNLWSVYLTIVPYNHGQHKASEINKSIRPGAILVLLFVSATLRWITLNPDFIGKLRLVNVFFFLIKGTE